MNLKRFYHSFCQKMIEHVYGINEDESKIFVFHQVTNDYSIWQDADCAITLRGFQNFIGRIKRLGVEFGKVEDFNNFAGDKKIYITFDDVYEDAVENAVPFLIKEKVPFCIFVTTRLIGKEGYITMEQLKALAGEPLCTIGFHTKSHKMMRFLSEDEVSDEINREPLEKLIDKKIDYFAYPFGSCYAVSKSNIKRIIDERYKLAFSTLKISINAIIRKKFDGFLPRININEENYNRYI